MKYGDKYNKIRETLKGLNDCIWKKFSKKEVLRIYLIVLLRINVFVSVSKGLPPKKRVCFKEESSDSNILRSVLFKVLKSMCMSTLDKGQWRRKLEVDSTSEPQMDVDLNNPLMTVSIKKTA